VAIISGCDASPVLQLAEHALDDIAAPIDSLIEGVWGPAGGGWDDGLDLSSLEPVTKTVGVIGLIGPNAELGGNCHSANLSEELESSQAQDGSSAASPKEIPRCSRSLATS
jgi:hypothetical protein